MKVQFDNIKFKKFTPESLNELETRINNEKEILKYECDNETKQASCNFVPIKKSNNLHNQKKPKKELDAGNRLPKQLANLFPQNLFRKPIEDIDEFYSLDYVGQILYD
jgi:hypothetical protein